MIPNNIFQIMSKINPVINSLQNMNSPDEVAQSLLNSGRVNQEQVNKAKEMWNRPDIRQMIQQKYGL